MLLVFSDLDATLLDHDNYSFNSAIPALSLLEKRGIPLILASSKTREEMVAIKKSMGNQHPFIYENGSGIFFRKKTSFGVAHSKIKGFLQSLKTKFSFELFSDFTPPSTTTIYWAYGERCPKCHEKRVFRTCFMERR